MSNTQKPVLAFFGATGGVAASALALALKDGYTCTALARTPSKLTTLLTTTYSLPPTLLTTHLTIHPGDIKSPTAVSRALVSPHAPNALVDTILFSVGAAPKLQASLFPVTTTDPTICADGMASLLSALSLLASQAISKTAEGEKPMLAAISTTGISPTKRDVPIPLNLAYYWLLSVPHRDKKAMESLLFVDAGGKVSGCLRGWVLVRPPLFTEGEGRGVERVRVGWVWGGDVKGKAKTGAGNAGSGSGAGEGNKDRVKEVGPVLGWTMDKRDAGAWVFRRVLETGGEGWEGKCVTLSY